MRKWDKMCCHLAQDHNSGLRMCWGNKGNKLSAHKLYINVIRSYTSLSKKKKKLQCQGQGLAICLKVMTFFRSPWIITPVAKSQEQESQDHDDSQLVTGKTDNVLTKLWNSGCNNLFPRNEAGPKFISKMCLWRKLWPRKTEDEKVKARH